MRDAVVVLPVDLLTDPHRQRIGRVHTVSDEDRHERAGTRRSSRAAGRAAAPASEERETDECYEQASQGGDGSVEQHERRLASPAAPRCLALHSPPSVGIELAKAFGDKRTCIGHIPTGLPSPVGGERARTANALRRPESMSRGRAAEIACRDRVSRSLRGRGLLSRAMMQRPESDGYQARVLTAGRRRRSLCRTAEEPASPRVQRSTSPACRP